MYLAWTEDTDISSQAGSACSYMGSSKSIWLWNQLGLNWNPNFLISSYESNIIFLRINVLSHKKGILIPSK